MDNELIKQLHNSDSVIGKGINHSRVNVGMMQTISEEAIQSTARIIQQVADSLNISEDLVVRKIRSLKGKINPFNLDDVTKKIYNSLLKVDDTLNYVEDIDKGKKHVLKKEYPNRIFVSGKNSKT